MKDGTSNFKYYLLEDTVELNVIIAWDDGYPTFDEITLADGVDVTEEILSFGLFDKLVDYAVDNPSYFIPFEVDEGERQWRSAREDD